jgi:hypothetical protein
MLICLVSGAAIGYRCALFRGHSHLKEILKSVHKEVWSNPDVNAAMRAADELYTPERNMVMTRFMTTGTQTGDIPAIPGYQPLVPANGKFQQFPELVVHRIVNGKVAEQWDFSDMWGANIQAGLIDPSNWQASAICRSGGKK